MGKLYRPGIPDATVDFALRDVHEKASKHTIRPEVPKKNKDRDRVGTQTSITIRADEKTHYLQEHTLTSPEWRKYHKRALSRGVVQLGRPRH